MKMLSENTDILIDVKESCVYIAENVYDPITDSSSQIWVEITGKYIVEEREGVFRITTSEPLKKLVKESPAATVVKMKPQNDELFPELDEPLLPRNLRENNYREPTKGKGGARAGAGRKKEALNYPNLKCKCPHYTQADDLCPTCHKCYFHFAHKKCKNRMATDAAVAASQEITSNKAIMKKTLIDELNLQRDQ